jgi:hypothetical protein
MDYRKLALNTTHENSNFSLYKSGTHYHEKHANCDLNAVVYIAHDAENLQFYLWLQDYTKRFNELKPEERALSPEWKMESTPAMEEGAIAHKKSKSELNFDKMQKPSYASLRMSDLPASDTATISDYQSFISNSVNSRKTVTEAAEDAVNQAGLKWQPCRSMHLHVAPIRTNFCSHNPAIPGRDCKGRGPLLRAWGPT